MNRLLIVATCALWSCAIPTTSPALMERDLGALAVSMRKIESRMAAEALLRTKPREDKPPQNPAGRRRKDHAPAPRPNPAPSGEIAGKPPAEIPAETTAERRKTVR